MHTTRHPLTSDRCLIACFGAAQAVARWFRSRSRLLLLIGLFLGLWALGLSVAGQARADSVPIGGAPDTTTAIVSAAPPAVGVPGPAATPLLAEPPLTPPPVAEPLVVPPLVTPPAVTDPGLPAGSPVAPAQPSPIALSPLAPSTGIPTPTSPAVTDISLAAPASCSGLPDPAAALPPIVTPAMDIASLAITAPPCPAVSVVPPADSTPDASVTLPMVQAPGGDIAPATVQPCLPGQPGVPGAPQVLGLAPGAAGLPGPLASGNEGGRDVTPTAHHTGRPAALRELTGSVVKLSPPNADQGGAPAPTPARAPEPSTPPAPLPAPSPSCSGAGGGPSASSGQARRGARTGLPTCFLPPDIAAAVSASPASADRALVSGQVRDTADEPSFVPD